MTELGFRCPQCGTPLGYQGLCWKCQSERTRQEVLAWSSEHIRDVQASVLKGIKKVEEWEDPEYTNFLNLLSYHDALSPEIPRKAVLEEVYRPNEIYYKAPADVRDQLISKLLNTNSYSEAADLMSCLAMQGDDVALSTLHELEQHPRPWTSGLYVGPASYAELGGWTFDQTGQRISLNFETCFALVQCENPYDSPIRIGRLREDVCPHCGGRMADIFVMDGRDERLKSFGIDGIFTATCCPNCVGFLKRPAFSRFSLDGSSEAMASELFDGSKSTKCYFTEEDFEAMASNKWGLSSTPVPPFYGAFADDLNTVGGFANWVQDCEHVKCPDCGRPMKYLAQIQWTTLTDNTEGTLYIEFCPDCQVAAMIHQQT